MCTPLLTEPPNWKQSKCPSVCEWIAKMKVPYAFNGKILSNEKNKVLMNVTHWVNLKIITVQWEKLDTKEYVVHDSIYLNV